MAFGDAYQKYLRSKDWYAKRQERLEIDDWECAWCSKHNCALHGHHLTYERLFDENVETDLITLCKRCHHYADMIRKQIKRIRIKADHPHRLDKLLLIYGYPHNMKDDRRLHVRRLHRYLKKLEGEK
jgi:5-methylcytosine-specific restriction endonuclease McrA